MTDEERKAIEYYTNNEYTFSFETDIDMEHFKKALGIEEKEEDTFEKHQMRFKTLLNLINKQEKAIDRMAEKIKKDTEWFYSEFDNKSKEEIKEYFMEDK